MKIKTMTIYPGILRLSKKSENRQIKGMDLTAYPAFLIQTALGVTKQLTREDCVQKKES